MNKQNPFSPTFPVNPEYFVNRTEILTSFEKAYARSTKTELPTPDNIAILGDWGVGKSSVMRKFEDIALKNKERKPFSALIELIPTACGSFNLFADKVADDIDRNFAVKSSIISRIRQDIRNWRIESLSIAGGIRIEKKIKERSPAAAFEDSLIELWKILEKSGIDIGILMLDDLHYLAEKYPDGLYDLRGIFQGLPRHGCNYMLCATGKKNMFSDIRELAEPLARFFNIKHKLDVFELKETRNAILKPIELCNLNMEIDDDVLKRIHELTMGHPFFIHFIMRDIVSTCCGKINLTKFESTFRDIEKIMRREKFDVDFSIASNKEKKILIEMAKSDADKISPSDLNIKNPVLQLGSLLKKNLVVKHERGEYSLYHPLFKRYMRSVHVKKIH